MPWRFGLKVCCHCLVWFLIAEGLISYIFFKFCSVKITFSLLRNKLWDFYLSLYQKIFQFSEEHVSSISVYSLWHSSKKQWPSSQVPVLFKLHTFHKASSPPSEPLSMLFWCICQVSFLWLILIHPSTSSDHLAML